MLTDGYNLPANKVIHIVGPIVQHKLTAGHEKNLVFTTNFHPEKEKIDVTSF